jgi:leader peptidase (prepilin peptidase)/N-methyltransferase
MDWFTVNLPTIIWCGWIFVVGLCVGSFLNVLIARLPFEKSIVWPGSRCFTCLKPIRFSDNIPILGYLRLRGRCRNCGTSFSPRYLWIEVFTGIAFVALFVVEIVLNLHRIPGVQAAGPAINNVSPPLWVWAFFAYHAVLLSLLIAASVIDAGHRIIPPLITYGGTAIGLIGAALLPWPWPSDAAIVAGLPVDESWRFLDLHIPLGLQLWPFWGPTPDWAPPGSWQLGLLNGLVGALAGTALIRTVKLLFEIGLGKEALGMGDADLMMMGGAFLGWQPIVLALFTGACAALAIKVPMMFVEKIRGTKTDHELPFGPGLAIGIVIVWLGWRWIVPFVQFVFFDLTLMGVVVVVMGGGMLAAGLFLRRGSS